MTCSMPRRTDRMGAAADRMLMYVSPSPTHRVIPPMTRIAVARACHEAGRMKLKTATSIKPVTGDSASEQPDEDCPAGQSENGSLAGVLRIRVHAQQSGGVRTR